jgi:hypothetical protein
LQAGVVSAAAGEAGSVAGGSPRDVVNLLRRDPLDHQPEDEIYERVHLIVVLPAMGKGLWSAFAGDAGCFVLAVLQRWHNLEEVEIERLVELVTKATVFIESRGVIVSGG